MVEIASPTTGGVSTILPVLTSPRRMGVVLIAEYCAINYTLMLFIQHEAVPNPNPSQVMAACAGRSPACHVTSGPRCSRSHKTPCCAYNRLITHQCPRLRPGDRDKSTKCKAHYVLYTYTASKIDGRAAQHRPIRHGNRARTITSKSFCGVYDCFCCPLRAALGSARPENCLGP